MNVPPQLDRKRNGEKRRPSRIIRGKFPFSYAFRKNRRGRDRLDAIWGEGKVRKRVPGSLQPEKKPRGIRGAGKGSPCNFGKNFHSSIPYSGRRGNGGREEGKKTLTNVTSAKHK